MKLKLQTILALAALASGSFAAARENAPYPSEKLAAFVVEKLDVTSLPSAYRPRKEKGKRTLADFGFTAQNISDSQAFVNSSTGAYRLSIRILEQTGSGIYACVSQPAQDGAAPKAQSVVLLRRKESNDLLKS